MTFFIAQRVYPSGPDLRCVSLLSPLFKAVLVGFILWLIAHRLLRDWMYSGEIWHPMLMDLSLFALCVCPGLAVLIVW